MSKARRKATGSQGRERAYLKAGGTPPALPCQNGFRGEISSSWMKNWVEQHGDPQITGSSPAICLRVISPKVPHEGQESTAQKGSSCSPTLPAFSSTNTVPG